MERPGRSATTAYQPLAAHIHAAQNAMTTNGGPHTPSYGGVVNTGVEWDFVINPDGTKSRQPSRSPARPSPSRAPIPDAHRSASSPLSASSDLAPPPIQPAAASAHAFTAHPSTHPHEPTISEEASKYVSRSVNAASAQQQQQQQQQQHAAAMSGSRSPAATSSNPRNYASAPQPSPGSAAAAAALAPPNANYPSGAPSSSSKRRQYRQVGDWILQKTLGQGSMGKVKLGVNVHTHERCAVKIVPRHRDDPKASDQSGRSKDESKEIRTVREASISLLLHHPYICGMRDFLVHQNHYYMVFEYIDGGQMLDYIIAHGRLRERAARKFARQIGSALDYCHHNNIVHRDLKIENILISNNGNIKIIDFGLSNLYSPQRHLSTFCGSLYFAAPELLNAKLYTGPEVDIWSFGIVLYVLVCGKVPFDDQSMPALHAKIKRGLAEYPAWLSNDCKSLLQRMLNTNPQERATLAEVLAHPWMTKGYDGRPDSHLVVREPLRAEDIDMDVIKRMQGFTFGSEVEIRDNLTKVLQSEAYQRCVAASEAHRSDRRGVGANGSTSNSALVVDSDSPKKKRFSGFDLKKKLFKEEKKIEEPVQTAKEPVDPSSGFDPLVSIYFLAREKKERAQVYGNAHFASSRASVEAASPAVGYNPVLNLPPSSPASGPSPTVQGRPKRPEDMPPATVVMQHAMADGAKSNIADVPPSSPAARQGVSPVPPVPPLPPTPGMDSGEIQRRMGEKDGKQDQRVSMDEVNSSMNRASLSRGTSQRTSNTPVPPITPPDWTSLGLVQDKSGGIRPAGSPALEEFEVADVANIDVKSVYLKGLFSVSTTSTKSARTLLRDISHVLDRIGIKYRPIRGGFECIHVPSIDLKSVVHGDEARSQLHVPPQHSLEQSPSKNKLNMRKSDAAMSTSTASRGDSSSQALDRGGGSSGTVAVLDASKPNRVDLDEADAWGAQVGASSGLCVRFEVFVVKVPWLPLHGIQFRRIGGDGWQYQQLAKTILREMRL